MSIGTSESFGVMGTGQIMCANGDFFDLVNPREEDIDINVIAHGLAKKDRASGMYNVDFPVSDHSILVAYLARYYAQQDNCSENTCNNLFLKGLLHDASEAYLVDLPRPLKYLPGFEKYRDIEANLQGMIYRKFGLDYLNDNFVKKADNIALIWEFYNFMPGREQMPWVMDGYSQAEADVDAAYPRNGIELKFSDYDTWRSKKDLYLWYYTEAMRKRLECSAV